MAKEKLNRIKISSDDVVENRLSIVPDKDKNGGICLAKLVNVQVVNRESKVDAKWILAGKTYPELQFEFEGVVGADQKPRYYTERIAMVLPYHSGYSNKELSKEEALESFIKRFTMLGQKVGHFYNVLKNDKKDKLVLDISELSEKDSVDTIIEEFTTLFNTIADAFNGKDGKSIYKDSKGTPKIVWLKLIADKDGKYFTTPTFIGTGIIEIFKQNIPTSLSIKAQSGEKITLNDVTSKTNLPGHTAGISVSTGDPNESINLPF